MKERPPRTEINQNPEPDASLPTSATEEVLADVEATVHHTLAGGSACVTHETVETLHRAIHTCECAPVFDQYTRGEIPTLERMFGQLPHLLDTAFQDIRAAQEADGPNAVAGEMRLLKLLKGREGQIRLCVQQYVNSVARFNNLKRLSAGGNRDINKQFVTPTMPVNERMTPLSSHSVYIARRLLRQTVPVCLRTQKLSTLLLHGILVWTREPFHRTRCLLCPSGRSKIEGLSATGRLQLILPDDSKHSKICRERKSNRTAPEIGERSMLMVATSYPVAVKCRHNALIQNSTEVVLLGLTSSFPPCSASKAHSSPYFGDALSASPCLSAELPVSSSQSERTIPRSAAAVSVSDCSNARHRLHKRIARRCICCIAASC